MSHSHSGGARAAGVQGQLRRRQRLPVHALQDGVQLDRGREIAHLEDRREARLVARLVEAPDALVVGHAELSAEHEQPRVVAELRQRLRCLAVGGEVDGHGPVAHRQHGVAVGPGRRVAASGVDADLGRVDVDEHGLVVDDGRRRGLGRPQHQAVPHGDAQVGVLRRAGGLAGDVGPRASVVIAVAVRVPPDVVDVLGLGLDLVGDQLEARVAVGIRQQRRGRGRAGVQAPREGEQGHDRIGSWQEPVIHFHDLAAVVPGGPGPRLTPDELPVGASAAGVAGSNSSHAG